MHDQAHPSHRCRLRLLTLGLLSMLLSTTGVRADHGPAGDKQHDLAKASQNPVSSLISVPFENNTTFDVGPQDTVQNALLIKPVIPMKLNDSWSWINRALVPIVYLGERFEGSGDKFGSGDWTYQGFLTPARSGKLIWGIGPSLQVPSGAQEFSTKKWSLGPNVVVLTMPGHWVIGALASNVWSVAGHDDRPDVNAFTVQPFVNYNMAKGWYLSTGPVITADWKADSDQRWTVPVGGVVGRVFKIGKQPVSAKLGGYYNAVKPDSAGDWTLQAGITLLFPK